MEVIKTITLQLTQEGAEAVAAALAGVEHATDRAGRSTGKFSQFMREQRKENRQASFLFRESAGSMLVLANAFGTGSKEAKVLTGALNAGFSTFQGLNWMLAGMKGQLGIAIALVGGLAAAFSSLSSEIDAVTSSSIDKFLSGFDLPVKDLEAALNNANAALTISKSKMQGLAFRTDVSANVTAGMSLEEAVRQNKEQMAIETRRQELLSGYVDKIRDQILVQETLNEVMRTGLEIGLEAKEAGILAAPVNVFPSGRWPGTVGPQNMFPDFEEVNTLGMRGAIRKSDKKWGKKWDAELNQTKEEFSLLNTSAAALGDTLSSSLGGAFEDVFGEANSLLEQFAQRLVEVLGENLFFSLLSLIPGVGFLGQGAQLFGNKTTAVGGGGSGDLERALGNPQFQMALANVQSNRARLGK